MVKKIALTFLVIVLVFVGFFYVSIRGSLPRYDGKMSLIGLEDSVVVQRDVEGVPTFIGQNREDISRAIGYTHGQERFFQMDLLRRSSAGELSELFGEKAVDFDKQRRFHQFRSLSQQIVLELPEDQRVQLQAYCEGVNQGMESLRVRPWEYLVLRETPKPWTMEDSFLCGLVMFLELQDSKGVCDLSRGYMKKLLPEEVYEFVTSNGSPWASALDGTTLPILPIPSADKFAYVENVEQDIAIIDTASPSGCSNEWVMSNKYTQEKGAILACDMHLSFKVPNIWYRVGLKYGDIEAYGVTLPGMPILILGSNTNVAWGVTNAQIDTADVIVIEEVNEEAYKTPEGIKEYIEEVELINVKGVVDPVEFNIKKTIWGPVLDHDYFGSPVALKWLAYDKSCVNMKLLDFESVKTTREALEKSRNVRTPALSLVIGDANGDIAWTFIGYLPKRQGYLGEVPVSFASGKAVWLGSLEGEEYPAIYNPESGMLWTANNRILGGDWKDILGQNFLHNPARAHQIHKRLQEIDGPATPEKMLEIQMDFESFFMQRWQGLLLETLEKDPSKEELKKVIEIWTGYASYDSIQYYIIREFRDKIKTGILKRVFSPCINKWDDFGTKLFDYKAPLFDYEEPIWLIASQQPDYLRGKKFASWNEELLSYVDEIIDAHRDAEGEIDWDDMRWGKYNTLDIAHPMTKALPFLSPWLNMPKDRVSGDHHVPMFMLSEKGASQRLAVIPGQEEEAIFQMPCGQSGHPLSPYYRAGHFNWLAGEPSPLVSKKVARELILLPN
jgi:penicillin G amidase